MHLAPTGCTKINSSDKQWLIRATLHPCMLVMYWRHKLTSGLVPGLVWASTERLISRLLLSLRLTNRGLTIAWPYHGYQVNSFTPTARLVRIMVGCSSRLRHRGNCIMSVW